MCKAEELDINWNASPDVQRPGDYVESWRILLWDRAFPAFLGSKAKKTFDKKTIFTKFPGTEDVVKRVIYRYESLFKHVCISNPAVRLSHILSILKLAHTRYFKRELLPKGAVTVQQLPKYFPLWIQRGSDQCIYSPQQLKRYKAPHLEAGCWYLDCLRGFTVDSEADVKSLLDLRAPVVEDSNEASEEDEEHQSQSSAPRPKRGRARQLRPLGSKSQTSQDTGAESSSPGKETGNASPTVDVPMPTSTTANAPSSIGASAITRSLIEQRKAKLYPQTTSSAGASISTHVSVFNSSVDSMLRRNKRQERKGGGDPDWIKTQDFIRKVCSDILTFNGFSHLYSLRSF